MPVNFRSFPVLSGEDAKRFLKRQEEHKKNLEKKVQKFLDKLQKNK